MIMGTGKVKAFSMYLHKSYINSEKFDKTYRRDLPTKNIVEITSGRYWEFVHEEEEYIKYEIEVPTVYH